MISILDGKTWCSFYVCGFATSTLVCIHSCDFPVVCMWQGRFIVRMYDIMRNGLYNVFVVQYVCSTYILHNYVHSRCVFKY